MNPSMPVNKRKYIADSRVLLVEMKETSKDRKERVERWMNHASLGKPSHYRLAIENRPKTEKQWQKKGGHLRDPHRC
jgi:hypothetical protein